jgi:hypothetical protein
MTLANEITQAFRGFRTFSFGDVRIVLQERHRRITDKTIQVTISRMAKAGKIFTILKGFYSLQRRDELAGFAFAPFYYGGLAALMIRDLIDNQVKMEIMTTRVVKKSFVSIYDGSSSVVLHHIPRKYYFGFGDVKYGDITVPVSGPEKTLIDLFYYKIKLSIQDYADLLRAVNGKKLADYLKTYDKRTANCVLNFIKKYKNLANSGKLKNPY